MKQFRIPNLSRRAFLRSTFVAGAASGFCASPITSAVASAIDDVEVMTWSACAVNCGSRCLLRVFSKKGQVIRIETDNSGSDSACCTKETYPQVRACPRGRAMRQRLYAEERLKYPMKRIGARGEGKFERISWKEALDTIAAKLKNTIAQYGNEAIFCVPGSGNQCAISTRNATFRFFNLIGGYLGTYSDYSAAQIQHIWPYMFGGFGYGSHKSKGVGAGSYYAQVKNAKLYVTFGNNPAVTRTSGGGQMWEFQCALDSSKVKTIMIDPIYTDSMLGKEDEWVPIKPGTDAALCEGIAYVLIQENLVDQQFLDTYCVGYDEKTLPPTAPKNASYKSYILGLSSDQTAKTPQWASKICGVPVKTIERLAREIGTAKPCFISQGWGPQRRANGETQASSIAMLALLTGQVGLPGTNTGAREGDSYGYDASLPAGKNPLGIAIPVFVWPTAINNAKNMRDVTHGVKGASALKQNIKFIWNTQGNCLVNQHGDSNQVAQLLRDETAVEMIVVVDTQMTPSAKFADILLPDCAQQEINELAADSYAVGDYNYIVALQKAVDPAWEQKANYYIMAELAERFGLKEKFTEGRTIEDWAEFLYSKSQARCKDLPSYAQLRQQGFAKYRVEGDSGIVLEDFRKDPITHKLPTPSGKIEIYSEKLAEVAKKYVLPKSLGQEIHPIPRFIATREMTGVGDPLERKYPLEAYGFHGYGRTHSTYHNVPWLRELHPDLVLINPVDAESRGIKTGDLVIVANDRGRLQLPAKVSPRIIPGVVAFPQGAWYAPDEKGLDKGGCINSLTSLEPSPLAKGNGVHTNLVEVTKA